MKFTALLFLVFSIGFSGCNSNAPQVSPLPAPFIESFEVTVLENGEPSHITVQHVLVAFDGSLQGKTISRTFDEARDLANEIVAKAAAGVTFDSLVTEYTDDSPPGIYKIANHDQPTELRGENRELWTRPRTGLVAAFGDVGFKLEVGEVGLAKHDRQSSPYGWHIIKRLK